MNRILIALTLIFFASCSKKDTEVTYYYAGIYNGNLKEHTYDILNGNISQTDTLYPYSIVIFENLNNKISVQGFAGADNISVDDEGGFTFSEFGRHFDGEFLGDSLFISSNSASQTDSSYHYDTIDFAGKRQE